MEEQEINSLFDYFNIILNSKSELKEIAHPIDTKTDFDSFDRFKPWFRGQANSEWELTPSIFRKDKLGNYLYPERPLFHEFKLKCAIEKNLHHSNFEWLSLMQHYGIPTRLMDWTENALIAIYFAVFDEKEFNNHGEIYILSPYKLNALNALCDNNLSIILPDSMIVSFISEIIDCENNSIRELANRIKNIASKYSKLIPNINEVINFIPFPMAVSPSYLNKRLVFQDGFFTLHGGFCVANTSLQNELPPIDIEVLNKNVNPEAKFLKSYIIPSKSKKKILNELKRLNIEEGKIFPELEHISNQIKSKWVIKIDELKNNN